MQFESTLPAGEPDLMRASAFQRYLDEMAGSDGDLGGLSRMTSLSPSLLMDLARFERGGQHAELLEVVAASLRHARALVVHLQADDRVLPLTIFPAEQLAHCPLPVPTLLEGPLHLLQLMHVEPAVLRPPGHAESALIGEAEHYHPLQVLTWALALLGPREELLPEIAGTVAYRVAPGLNLRGLPMEDAMRIAVLRLQLGTTNFREICEWPGMGRERTVRLLNALYLQAGLIVTRSHPAATNEGWFSTTVR